MSEQNDVLIEKIKLLLTQTGEQQAQTLAEIKALGSK
jgi:hypothetical protein